MITSHRTLTVLLVFVGALFALGGFISLALWISPAPHSAIAEPFPPELSLDPAQISAKAAIVYDPQQNRILFSKNSSESLPLASLTKLMAAEAVLERVPTQTTIVITPQALRPEGDSGLRVGESWSLHDLLLYGLVASSNDAMAAAVGSLGQDAAQAMNSEAARLGLTQTYFLNPTGLDLDLEISGAYGSARDVAVLAGAFMSQHPEYFSATATQGMQFTVGERTIVASSTAAPLLSLPGFIGAKTGYTDLAGGNLVAAFDISVGHPLIAVVLGSTREGRFEDMHTLINASRAALSQP